MEFLKRASNCVVYFVEEASEAQKLFEEVKDSETKVIIIILEQKGKVTFPAENVVQIPGNKNISNLCSFINKNINQEEAEDSLMSLVDHSQIASECSFSNDEMNNSYRAAKIRSDKIVDIIKQVPATDRKRKFLPYQGLNWKMFCNDEKEECKMRNMGNMTPDEYKDYLRSRRSQHRDGQRKTEATAVMKIFIEGISKEDEKERKYFLQLFQLELNKLSDLVMPDILRRYNESKKNLDNDTRGNGSFNLELEKITEEFNSCSFGLEHFLRELGQLYEAHHTRDFLNEPSNTTPFNNLPSLMSRLILMGYPLEIMDGNVSGVPIVWLRAVVKELNAALGKSKKLSVLSILGVQSTGKSTLLNTMFGCKFAVSSGRCTKGVFVQQVPVLKSDDGAEGEEYDYILVMDTEGLRSPELSGSGDFTHDNEIATFVSCLANTTILNFYGETFTTEMAEILQIVSTAYLRMRDVDLKSVLTHLVFAGVQNITAQDRNEMSITNVMNQLNDIIVDEANKNDKVYRRQDVFPLCGEEFKKLRFPQTFPVLWQGSMSQPNEKYGEEISKLRMGLYESIVSTETARHRTQTLGNKLQKICLRIKFLKIFSI